VFTGIWIGGPKEKDHWEDLDVGGRITLRWTLVRQLPVASFCEHGNEPLGSIRK
jgi:hypothetical protein